MVKPSGMDEVLHSTFLEIGAQHPNNLKSTANLWKSYFRTYFIEAHFLGYGKGTLG